MTRLGRRGILLSPHDACVLVGLLQLFVPKIHGTDAHDLDKIENLPCNVPVGQGIGSPTAAPTSTEGVAWAVVPDTHPSGA